MSNMSELAIAAADLESAGYLVIDRPVYRRRRARALAAMAVLVVFAIVAGIGGALVGARAQSAKDQGADITVMPCSAWASTSHPHIPPYTFDGACALPDGSLSLPGAATATTTAAPIPNMTPRYVGAGETVWASNLSSGQASTLGNALARARHDKWCGDIRNGGDDFNPSAHECVDLGYLSLTNHRMRVYTLAAHTR